MFDNRRIKQIKMIWHPKFNNKSKIFASQKCLYNILFLLTVKINDVVQVKRSYEHISKENVTGEHVFSSTKGKIIIIKLQISKNV